MVDYFATFYIPSTDASSPKYFFLICMHEESLFILCNALNFNKCIVTWIHDYSVMNNSFTTPRYLPCFIHSNLPITKPLVITDRVTVSVVLIIQCKAFSGQLLSPSNLPLCLFMARQLIHLLSLNNMPCVNMPQFIHPAIEGHLGYF